MINIEKKEDCCGCSACKNICPVNAISMIEDEKGFLYPIINENKCINCGLCENVCPIINVKNEDNVLPEAYAAFNKNEEIRMKSSSGGVFSLIAEYILNENGIVYGAVFNDKFEVEHKEIITKEDLKYARGSKYIQSDLKKIFKNIKKQLDDKKLVLFTGTPCQIEGLKQYLNKDYSNLFLQDLICHVVPSKKVWKKYLEYIEKENKGKITNISFRDKQNKGWNKYELLFEFENNKKFVEHSKDIFMKVFLSDIALRDSCYNCRFKKRHRESDITLADFWGIDNIMPEMNDEKGTSLIIVHTAKGRDLLDKIKEKIKLERVDFLKAISNNPSMTMSANSDKQKNEFLEKLDKISIEELVNQYIK